MSKRSDAAIAAADHWKKRKTEVIVDVNTDTDTDTDPDTDKDADKDADIDAVAMLDLNSPFELIYTPSIEGVGTTLESLASHPDLISSYQFNFSVDVEFFLKHIHKNANPKVTFITGIEGLVSDVISRMQLYEVRAPLSDRFGVHHTKMMINLFPSSIEIIVMTANLTLLDFGGLTQMCWRSGRLKKLTSGIVVNNTFQKDLSAYLQRYRLSTLNQLAQTLAQYDFSSIDVELFASDRKSVV